MLVNLTKNRSDAGGLKERKRYNTRQPRTGEKNDYDSENSWILEGLPSSSRKRRRAEGRG